MESVGTEKYRRGSQDYLQEISCRRWDETGADQSPVWYLSRLLDHDESSEYEVYPCHCRRRNCDTESAVYRKGSESVPVFQDGPPGVGSERRTPLYRFYPVWQQKTVLWTALYGYVQKVSGWTAEGKTECGRGRTDTGSSKGKRAGKLSWGWNLYTVQ